MPRTSLAPPTCLAPLLALALLSAPGAALAASSAPSAVLSADACPVPKPRPEAAGPRCTPAGARAGSTPATFTPATVTPPEPQVRGGFGLSAGAAYPGGTLPLGVTSAGQDPQDLSFTFY